MWSVAIRYDDGLRIECVKHGLPLYCEPEEGSEAGRDVGIDSG